MDSPRRAEYARARALHGPVCLAGRVHHAAGRRSGRPDGHRDLGARADRHAGRPGCDWGACAGPGRRFQPAGRRRGFPGTVVRIDLRGISIEADACSGATLRVAAGEPWDDLVAHTVGQGLRRAEALSGIPGLTGATPIQNVGAYGSEVSDVVTQVRTIDRASGRVRTVLRRRVRVGYRTSRFKHPLAPDWPGRYVVTAVTFQLRLGTLSAPVRYPELARALGIAVGERAPAADERRGAGSARARAWCCPRVTTTPGAPARSSPTWCCRPTKPPPCRPGAALRSPTAG